MSELISNAESDNELIEVINVKAIEHCILLAQFENGKSGRVIINPSWLTGVFEPLKIKEVFFDVFVEYGAVTWVNGLTLSPISMYQAIKNQGFYYLN